MSVCVFSFLLLFFTLSLSLACLSTPLGMRACACVCVRACVRAVAGWALCKHKKYVSRCRSPAVEAVAERTLLMSNGYFAEYPQIVSRHLAFPWIDANSICVSG